jgi:hypothetical protein
MVGDRLGPLEDLVLEMCRPETANLARPRPQLQLVLHGVPDRRGTAGSVRPRTMSAWGRLRPLAKRGTEGGNNTCDTPCQVPRSVRGTWHDGACLRQPEHSRSDSGTQHDTRPP